MRLRRLSVICLIALLAACTSDAADEPLGESAQAVVDLAARLGIDLTDEQRDCVRDRSVSPNDIGDPTYGFARCLPDVVATSFGDRLAASTATLGPAQAVCVNDAVSAAVAGATDVEIEELVIDDQLPSSTTDDLRDGFAACGLSDDVIDASLGD